LLEKISNSSLILFFVPDNGEVFRMFNTMQAYSYLSTGIEEQNEILFMGYE
jgi:hypothetical protein